MKEDFLHYLWKFKKFDVSDLKTTNNEPVVITNGGQYLQLAGPDFFNAQLRIGKQKWAGNVEIHLKSSDWYLHRHETDPAYENIILHVVWEHDTEIFRKDNSEIPVLELKKYVSEEILQNYHALVFPKSWIYCEKDIASIDSFVLKNWQERLFLERLERKSIAILELFETQNRDWEAVLFCLLAKNFGLNTNGSAFLKMANAIPFSIIRKEASEIENLEGLLFGMTGLLNVDKEDTYFKDLKFRFYYLLQKFQIEAVFSEPVQFFKHRPDNFPTIRLSQLSNLYHSQHHLFSKIIAAKSAKEIYEIFTVSVSGYWQTHYQFDRESPKKKKALSKSFIDLLIVNTIVPVQFAYAKSQGKEMDETLLEIIIGVGAEKNAIVEKFSTFGITAENAFETQSLLQLKNEYCQFGKCLECAIGIELLKTNPIKM